MKNNAIGVEVTESVPEDYSKCLGMAELINPALVIDMSLFKWGTPKKTTKQLKSIISNSKTTGPGWRGTSSTNIDWANYMHESISDKLNKLNSTGYTDLPNYWLSIYDNLPIPYVDAADATKILLSLLSKNCDLKRSFSRIFIEHGPIIIDIEDNNFTNHVLYDIWNSPIDLEL